METEPSFLNQLVGWITSDIYRPMAITMTCAEQPGGRAEKRAVAGLK